MKKAFKTLTTSLSGIGVGYLSQKQAKNVEILPKYGRDSMDAIVACCYCKKSLVEKMKIY